MRYVLGFFPPDRVFALVDALSEIHVHEGEDAVRREEPDDVAHGQYSSSSRSKTS